MPRPRKLPDADTLHQLRVVQGKTYEEIAETYGVTRAAVHLALQKSGLVQPRPRYDKQIPWKVSMAHANETHLSMLRLAARRDAGHKLPPYKERALDAWIKALEEKDAVVDYRRTPWPGYGPDGQGGFALVPRREGVDTWLIREPGQAGGSGGSLKQQAVGIAAVAFMAAEVVGKLDAVSAII